MSEKTYDALAAIRRDVEVKTGCDSIGPADVFLPWAGNELFRSSRGIYYVGIAERQHSPSGHYTFSSALQAMEDFREYPNSPFWWFLDCLTREILGGSYTETRERWGWSNLWKIAATSSDEPQDWPVPLRELQKPACIAALKEELNRLRKSLIVFASSNTHGILYEATAREEHWNTEPRASCIYWYYDGQNTFIHCYHPAYMNRHPDIWTAAVADTVQIAAATLPRF